MSERITLCGNCGGEIRFRSAGAVLVVCEFCSSASYRRDVDFELVGKLAQRALLDSRFQIGTRGEYGGEPFEVRGQLQLDHGRGLWNEWCAERANGGWLWIAEAQGEIWVLAEPREAPASLPEPDEARNGKSVALDGGQPFLVTEAGKGKVVTAAGELPVEIAFGETTRYADLQRGDDEVATLDWTRADAPELLPDLLIGRRVNAAELALEPDTQPAELPPHVRSRRIDCANCGGAIELRDAVSTQRVGCGACDTLLDVTSDKVRAIELQRKYVKQTRIPLGSEGELRGERCQVIGFLVRSVRAGGRRYGWDEFLLKGADGGYRWLIENQGHWMLASSISPGSLRRGSTVVRRHGVEYKHFTTGTVRVDYVLGECYWDVAVGEQVRGRDYVAPAGMISIESNENETVASFCSHVEPSEVRAAFGVSKLPVQRGVGPIQPNPHRPARLWAAFGLAVAALFLARIVVGALHQDRVVLSDTFGPTPASDQEETVQFTEPFEITARRGNLRIDAAVPGLDQGWVGLYGALVNEQSGEVTTFDLSAQHYHGIADGERWTEGNGRGRAWLGSVPAGTYRMRLASVGYQQGLGRSYRLSAKSQVPRTLFLTLALLGLLPFPLIVFLLWFSFEKSRWAESDHPWFESEDE